jgi:hypothetical protein
MLENLKDHLNNTIQSRATRLSIMGLSIFSIFLGHFDNTPINNQAASLGRLSVR